MSRVSLCMAIHSTGRPSLATPSQKSRPSAPKATKSATCFSSSPQRTCRMWALTPQRALLGFNRLRRDLVLAIVLAIVLPTNLVKIRLLSYCNVDMWRGLKSTTAHNDGYFTSFRQLRGLFNTRILRFVRDTTINAFNYLVALCFEKGKITRIRTCTGSNFRTGNEITDPFTSSLNLNTRLVSNYHLTSLQPADHSVSGRGTSQQTHR
jgi:hypothetical protein